MARDRRVLAWHLPNHGRGTYGGGDSGETGVGRVDDGGAGGGKAEAAMRGDSASGHELCGGGVSESGAGVQRVGGAPSQNMPSGPS